MWARARANRERVPLMRYLSTVLATTCSLDSKQHSETTMGKKEKKDKDKKKKEKHKKDKKRRRDESSSDTTSSGSSDDSDADRKRQKSQKLVGTQSALAFPGPAPCQRACFTSIQMPDCQIVGRSLYDGAMQAQKVIAHLQKGSAKPGTDQPFVWAKKVEKELAEGKKLKDISVFSDRNRQQERLVRGVGRLALGPASCMAHHQGLKAQHQGRYQQGAQQELCPAQPGKRLGQVCNERQA